MRTIRAALLILCATVTANSNTVQAQSAERTLDTRAYIDVAHAVLPGVVNITIEPRNTPRPEAPEPNDFDDLIRFFQDSRGMGRGLGTSSGSGVVVRIEGTRGYVVTNNHVIDTLNDRTQARLTFHHLTPGTTDFSTTTEITGSQVRLIGADKLSDLAVLEFDIPEGLQLRAIEWADSDQAEIGEHVVALGNPLELNHTVTAGIISGKSRYLGRQISMERLLQTNAVIQPGNSGGPLVNLDGRILGINNAIASRNGLWQGTSFAIPSNDAKRISDSLIDRGRVSRGYLGVTMEDLFLVHPEVLTRYGLRREDGGVHIKTVVRNSPADIAGIHARDIVLEIDDTRVQNSDEMLQTIARRNVDSTVNVKLIRLSEDDKPLTLTVTARLGERPDETIINDMHGAPENSNELIPRIQQDPGTMPSRRDLGLSLQPWYDTATRESALEVRSVADQSPAQQAGIRSGDLVLSVNGRPVRTIGDFRAALATVTSGNDAQIMIRRQGIQQLVVVTQP